MSELMDGCILLDDATSALDGLELLVQTRQAKGSFPLVLMTTQAGADFSANAIKAGIATLIERPFSDDALFAANPFRPVREKRDGRARRHSKRGQCDRGMGPFNPRGLASFVDGRRVDARYLNSTALQQAAKPIRSAWGRLTRQYCPPTFRIYAPTQPSPCARDRRLAG